MHKTRRLGKLRIVAFDDIPRIHSFSLGDFHDFDFCVFRFFVNHHLGKKYELAEGSANQTIGSLLDLAVKKFHLSRSYGQSEQYLPNLIKAAFKDKIERILRTDELSFCGKPFCKACSSSQKQDWIKQLKLKNYIKT